jgi:uncharacterized protein (DUF1330 family)
MLALNAEKGEHPMSAYWIGRAQAKDPVGMKEYGRLVAHATSIYPNQALVRAGAYKTLEGPDDFDRFVLLKFASMEAALTYYNSPEYQAAAAVRRASCDRCELTLVEGID